MYGGIDIIKNHRCKFPDNKCFFTHVYSKTLLINQRNKVFLHAFATLKVDCATLFFPPRLLPCRPDFCTFSGLFHWAKNGEFSSFLTNFFQFFQHWHYSHTFFQKESKLETKQRAVAIKKTFIKAQMFVYSLKRRSQEKKEEMHGGSYLRNQFDKFGERKCAKRAVALVIVSSQFLPFSL